MIKSIHAYVSGKVQGVFFRVYTRQYAQETNVLGWVRNCSDGRVEFVAVGEDNNITQFLSLVRKGSPYSRVDNVEVEVISADEKFSSFSIVK